MFFCLARSGLEPPRWWVFCSILLPLSILFAVLLCGIYMEFILSHLPSVNVADALSLPLRDLHRACLCSVSTACSGVLPWRLQRVPDSSLPLFSPALYFPHLPDRAPQRRISAILRPVLRPVTGSAARQPSFFFFAPVLVIMARVHFAAKSCVCF